MICYYASKHGTTTKIVSTVLDGYYEETKRKPPCYELNQFATEEELDKQKLILLATPIYFDAPLSVFVRFLEKMEEKLKEKVVVAVLVGSNKRLFNKYQFEDGYTFLDCSDEEMCRKQILRSCNCNQAVIDQLKLLYVQGIVDETKLSRYELLCNQNSDSNEAIQEYVNHMDRLKKMGKYLAELETRY